jgi:hypothetical protein
MWFSAGAIARALPRLGALAASAKFLAQSLAFLRRHLPPPPEVFPEALALLRG